jgi:biotin carboxylase
MAEGTLLVLAASTYQVDTIRKASARGLRVLTTDNRPDNPGHRLADRAFNIDTTDRDAVLALARDERITGLIAPGTDVALTALAHVAAALGLPGPPKRAAEVLTSKLEFRAFQQAEGLPFPAFAEWDGRPIDDRRGAGPWIVKPNRASGSKAIRIVTDAHDIERCASMAMATSIDGRAIVEQEIDGSQHTCEGFLENGTIAFSLVTDRLTAPTPYTATAGHRVPSRLGVPSQDEAIRQLAHVFAALGVRDGPFDCDFVATHAGVVLLEATPRLGGNSLSRLVAACCDFDIVDAAIRHACGEPLRLPSTSSIAPSAVVILGVRHTGTLTFDADALARLREEPWVRYVVIDKPAGSDVAAFVDGRQRIGEALISGRTRDEVDARAAEVVRRLHLGVTGSEAPSPDVNRRDVQARSPSHLIATAAAGPRQPDKAIGS